jgi:hypothetical protein
MRARWSRSSCCKMSEAIVWKRNEWCAFSDTDKVSWCLHEILCGREMRDVVVQQKCERWVAVSWRTATASAPHVATSCAYTYALWVQERRRCASVRVGRGAELLRSVKVWMIPDAV